MVGEAHSMYLENETETTEIAALTASRERGQPCRPQISTNPHIAARRIDRLEGAEMNLSNMMAQFVAILTNAQAAPIPAVARPLGARDKSVGHGGQDPALVACGDQAAQSARNPEASQNRTRGGSQCTRVSIFD